MLVRKNQIKKKVYKVLIYPEPYELMIEAVDRITAKQEAIKKLGIRETDIFNIKATTQYFRMTNNAKDRNKYGRLSTIDKVFFKKMRDDKYI